MRGFFSDDLFGKGRAVLEKLTEFFTSGRFWGSIVVVAVALLAALLLKKFKSRVVGSTHIDGKKETNARFVFSAAKYVVFLIAIITVLEINGVNVSGLVTGLGVMSIVVGFALQDVLKDFVMGNNIMLDHFFVVGDTVKYGDVVGKVISFNIRVTRIKDICTGDVLTVSNRNISEMTVLSDNFYVNIPAPYTEPAERMRRIMEEICREAEKRESIEDCEFLGTNEFGSSSISYLIKTVCPPENHRLARRILLGITQDIYAKENIQIPFDQLDVHINPDERKKNSAK